MYSFGWYGFNQVAGKVIIVQGVMIFAYRMCNCKTFQVDGIEAFLPVGFFKCSCKGIFVNTMTFCGRDYGNGGTICTWIVLYKYKGLIKCWRFATEYWPVRGKCIYACIRLRINAAYFQRFSTVG